MFNNSKIMGAMIALVAFLGLNGAANAQILIIDDERVEKEAASYNDYRLQTAELRRQFAALQQFTTQGGVAEQQMAELEKQKSVIGQENFDKQRGELGARYQQAIQGLNQLQVVMEQVRNEALSQIQRARQPIFREILSERKAQAIMGKRIVIQHAPGLDITTEFIERLDASISTVTLASLPKFTPPANGAQPAAGSDVEGTPIPDGR